MSKIPVKSLYDNCEMMLRDGWGYIWGASGEVWTQKKQDAATREMTVKYGSRWIGKHVVDCSGVMVYIWRQHGLSIYHGSNTIRRKYCGPLTNTPQPGYAAFKVKADDYHHIGIVAEDGMNVYEAKGTQTGFVMSAASSWDCFAPFNDVDYLGKKQGGKQVIYQAKVATESGDLNIRSGAGTNFPVVGRLAKGEIVDVLEEQDDWAHIIDGKEGWVSMKYLKPVKAEPPAEENLWGVLIPCDSEEEAQRYAENFKGAMVLKCKKPDA